MMLSSDVTIVIPACNAEQFITQALDSINNQTVLPGKIIVVENASTDGTYAYVEQYARSSAVPIEVIRTDCPGVSNARNIGFSLADTPLIGMLDADDVYLDDFIYKVLGAFSLDPSLVLFFGNRKEFAGTEWKDAGFLENTRVTQLPYRDLGDSRRVNEGLFTALLYGNFVSCSGAVVKKDAAFRAGLFPLNLKNSEDRFFFCKLALEGSSAYTMETTHGYRVNPASASRSVDLHLLFSQSDLALSMLWSTLSREDLALGRMVHSARYQSAFDYLYACSENGYTDFQAGKGNVSASNLKLKISDVLFLYLKSIKNETEWRLARFRSK